MYDNLSDNAPVYECLYAGILKMNFAGKGHHLGALEDYFGKSDLNEIVFTDTKLEFVKKYYGRDDKIHYSFEKKDKEFWIGTWKHSIYNYNKGVTWCLLTPIEEKFFDLFKVKKQLCAV